MLGEIRSRDLLRTMILSAFGLGLLTLCFYLLGELSSTIFEGSSAFIVAAAVFDTFWLNAKRTQLQPTTERLVSRAEKQERQIAGGRKITRRVDVAVIVGLKIPFLIKLWFFLHL